MPGDKFYDSASPESLAKMTMVQKYFAAWASIMALKCDRIAYFDLFAGRGRYRDGTPSTPLRVLEMAIQDHQLASRLVTVFNDKSSDHCKTLQENVSSLAGIEILQHQPQFMNTTVGTELVQLVREMGRMPSLYFLDPWGWKGLSLTLFASALAGFGCECILFFNYNQINRFLTAPDPPECLVDLFGEERFNNLKGKVGQLSSSQREQIVIGAMEEALRDGGARFCLSFRFLNATGTRTSHYIIHACKHPLGHLKMKEVMWQQSTRDIEGIARFEYAPMDDGQLTLDRPLDDLKEDLLRNFCGRILTMTEVCQQHHPNTPYIPRNYKRALSELEDEGRIQCDAHRKGTFADHIRVAFPAQGEP